MEIGRQPLPAIEGWSCTYFPARGELSWSEQVEEGARRVWQVFRMLKRAPPI